MTSSAPTSLATEDLFKLDGRTIIGVTPSVLRENFADVLIKSPVVLVQWVPASLGLFYKVEVMWPSLTLLNTQNHAHGVCIVFPETTGCNILD
jgi:hypothetical protein